MKRTDAVIIGGGQAGLAMSRCLTDRAIDHVVLERGRVAERWRSERWDSLRLLTPNWQTGLPSWQYRGPDPHGFMRMPEVVQYFQSYARSFSAPVESGTNVLAVENYGDGYRVTTDRGTWQAGNVIIATGYCDIPHVPAMGAAISKDIHQLVPTKYRNPGQLPTGGVLVVGASASGIQIAKELHESGRPVTIAVGKHTRLPRRYRGRDIMYWFDATGIIDDTEDDVYDIDVSRRQPSLQLVGGTETIDLAVLQKQGVRLAGRALSVNGSEMTFAKDLERTTAAADAKIKALLRRIDAFINRAGLASEVDAAEPALPSITLDRTPPDKLALSTSGIETVIWATGFRRSYPWLRVPVTTPKGELVHDGGITPARGLYALGLRFLRRRNSSFIDGVGRDANELATVIAARLDNGHSAVA